MQEKIDYFFHESFLNKDEIKHLNTYIESNYVDVERSTHQALNKEGESKKKTKTLIINYGQIKDKLKNIQSLINHANQNYFGYKIYPQNDFDKCLYNIYESKNKGEYGWHTDSSRSNIYDMKLTILINLSNQTFEGGDFNIFNGTEYTVNNLRFPGTIVIFKSFLNHRVLPITKGQRKSLTLFCNGPMLR